jgi:hypothetical protein
LTAIPKHIILGGILLLIPLLIPVTSGLADEMNLGPQNIVLNITSPEQDDVLYVDVVPAYFTVEGKIFGSGIRNVTVKNQNETKICGKISGNFVDVSCTFPAIDGSNQIIITIVDDKGYTVLDSRNFTIIGGLFGPGTVWVSGYVFDANGTPLKDVTLTFEAIGTGQSTPLRTITDMNGRFSMKKTWGTRQKITVSKPGYKTQVRDVTFDPLTNEINFILAREGQIPVPLHVFTIIIAIITGIIGFSFGASRIRKRE